MFPEGPEKFSRRARLFALLILASIAWMIVALSVSLSLSGLAYLVAQIELLGRNG